MAKRVPRFCEIVRMARESRITVPERAHPLARFAFAEMKRQRVRYLEMEWRSGVLASTWKAWRKSNLPSLPTIEAVLGALNWHVLPVPKPEALPPELRADLEAIAAKHSLETLPCLEMISSCISFRSPGSHVDARERRSV